MSRWRAFEVPETPLDPSPESTRQEQLYERGLSKTVGAPYRKYVRRLALQQALERHKEIAPPS